MNFAGHVLEAFAGDAQQRTVTQRTGAGHERGAAFNWTLGYHGQQRLRGGGQRRAEKHEQREAVEAAKTHRRAERAVGGFEQQRIEEETARNRGLVGGSRLLEASNVWKISMRLA